MICHDTVKVAVNKIIRKKLEKSSEFRRNGMIYENRTFNRYVFGYCKQRQDFRLYKLRRLWDLQLSEEIYEVRAIPDEKLQFGTHMTDDYFVTAIYDSGVKYKLVEEYGQDSFSVMNNGKLYAKWGFNSAEDALPWFLGLGDKVKIIEPPEMVEKIRMTLATISEKYL